MDLFWKIGVLAVVLIAIAGLAFAMIGSQPKHAITAEDAVMNATLDAQQHYPGATINQIGNATQSKLEAGSWYVVLSVIYNSTKPCPTVFIEDCDYPATGYVCSLQNTYTDNCTISGISDAPTYFISLPEIAIVQSYSASMQAKDYVNTFGYSNTTVNAKYHESLNTTSTPLDSDFANVWIVNYTATNANYSDYVLVSGRSVLGNYALNRS